MRMPALSLLPELNNKPSFSCPVNVNMYLNVVARSEKSQTTSIQALSKQITLIHS